MTPAELRMNELSTLRSQLKQAGNYRAAIPLQLEIIELLGEVAKRKEDVANGHNYASVLYFHCGLYASAEWHARRALDLSQADTARHIEARGCYSFVLARILAAQYRFDEALAFGEAAVRDYGVYHQPEEFLSRISAEVEQIRNRTWSPPPD